MAKENMLAIIFNIQTIQHFISLIPISQIGLEKLQKSSRPIFSKIRKHTQSPGAKS